MVMPKTDGWPGSRDFHLPTIPCKVETCPANMHGYCIMASTIKIEADGRCEQARKSFEYDEKKKGRLP